MVTASEYKDRFIIKAREVHGDKYDYDQFVWTGAQSKGTIVCKLHGPFEKSPEKHIQRKQGCKVCSNLKKSADRSYTREQFLEKAREVHGDHYDYNEFVYQDSRTKSKIICKLHNVAFEQTPAHHLQGHVGCKQCIAMKTQDTHLERYGETHHSKTTEFQQKVRETSLQKFGVDHRSKADDFREVMRQSNLERHGVNFASQSEAFKERVRQTNQEKYGVDHHLQAPEVRQQITETMRERYGVPNALQIHISPESLAILNDKDAIQRLLETHSVKELARSVLGVSECTLGRYCHKHGIDLPSSSYEGALASFLREHGVAFHMHDRMVIKPLEIDILIPDIKLGIEFCGIYWHGEEVIPDRKYHLSKLEAMSNAGFRLITIFEDEWLHHREIVERRLLHLIGKSERGKGARDLRIENIDATAAARFLNTYHIQGAGQHGYARYGAFDGNDLVAVMTFSSPRLSLGRTYGGDELLRFSTDGKNYPGVASRLFRAYVREHKSTEVISYADRRWSDGNLYKQMGFQLLYATQPNYWYTDRNEIKREHRFKYRKDRIQHLVENGDQKTEHQIMQELGRDRIWDCGSYKYIWRA